MGEFTGHAMGLPKSDARMRVENLAVGKSCVVNKTSGFITNIRRAYPDRVFTTESREGGRIVTRIK